MTKCKLCGKEKEITKSVGICLECIREKPDKVKELAYIVHKKVRESLNLPPSPPKTSNGIKCNLCYNQCEIGDGEKGYCGLRENINGKLETKTTAEFGLLDFYYDPIPTNCCASWFCAAEKEAKGRYNLAVFFYGCSFNCLFCQNYTHKFIKRGKIVSVDELVKVANKDDVYCICFFGGTPEVQFPFVINFSEKILKIKNVRICFEWNGSGNTSYVRKTAEIALRSRGIIKFDLKSYDETLNLVLTGISNKKTYENFTLIAKEFLYKTDHPMLTATTLLVPGYIDKFEVEKISKFISNLNPEIPYSLLVFHPEFYMNDLPITPKETVFECYHTAKKYLKNVNIGNLHLLS